jgi:hypothetical protein
MKPRVLFLLTIQMKTKVLVMVLFEMMNQKKMLVQAQEVLGL